MMVRDFPSGFSRVGVTAGVTAGVYTVTAHCYSFEGPPYPFLEQVAAALGVDAAQLRELAGASARTRGYRHKQIPKTHGIGTRPIAAPAPHIRGLLDKLDAWLKREAILPIHAAAHGFVAGRSAATHAAAHEGAVVLIGIDLKDWFSSVTTRQLEAALRADGWSGDAAHVVARIATDVQIQALPQGAPTSPLFANFVARHLDRHLMKLATAFGMVYTRYADDLTFSSKVPLKPASVDKLLVRIEYWATSEGFQVKHRKTMVNRPWQRMEIAGNIVVNPVSMGPGGVPLVEGASPARVCRKYIRRLKAAIYNHHRGRARWTRGQIESAIGYVQMVNPEQAKVLKTLLEEWRCKSGV